MSAKYPHLTSPFKVGNVLLRNRMLATASKPGYVQGWERYPTDAIISHYANKAKNGAAVVTATMAANTPKENIHSPMYDPLYAPNQNYISQVAENIHYYGALASTFLWPKWDDNFDASDGIPSEPPRYTPGRPAFSWQQITDMVEAYADQAALMQELGFDMAYIHAAYRGMPVARFLSPLTNKRNDEFGGSAENRMRFLNMICDRIKQKCGRDFLLEVCLSGHDPGEGGISLAETAEMIRLGVGHFDLVQLRAPTLDPAHPTGYSQGRIPFLYMAEAVKKADTGMPVEIVGGCFYPDDAEAVLAEGKADLIAMARSWVSNPDYGKLVYEGRPDDIVPCLRCNKCLRLGPNEPWLDACSVNPFWGLEHRIDRMITPPGNHMNIAVVGGGPAGMEAAVTLRKRGHRVTLYEKSDKLGGQLNAGDVPSFKWPLRDFKEYLIRQVNKLGVTVRLSTEATREMLAEQGFDRIIAAIGAEPVIPPIPGAENAITAVDVYGNESALAKNVVVIGGGEIGVETGMHLAERGHTVTLIEMRDKLAPDAVQTHFYSMLKNYADNCGGFSYILDATCSGISESGVSYADKLGQVHVLPAESVVLAVGSRGKTDEAAALYSPGDEVTLIGDCKKAATVQKAMRSAFAAASQI